jgi:hypothetical protein
MSKKNLRQTAVLALVLLFLAPLAVHARSWDRSESGPAGLIAHASGPLQIVAQVWHGLVGLWENAGPGLDPHGDPTGGGTGTGSGNSGTPGTGAGTHNG